MRIDLPAELFIIHEVQSKFDTRVGTGAMEPAADPSL